MICGQQVSREATMNLLVPSLYVLSIYLYISLYSPNSNGIVLHPFTSSQYNNYFMSTETRSWTLQAAAAAAVVPPTESKAITEICEQIKYDLFAMGHDAAVMVAAAAAAVPFNLYALFMIFIGQRLQQQKQH